jgi:hypothetical protein
MREKRRPGNFLAFWMNAAPGSPHSSSGESSRAGPAGRNRTTVRSLISSAGKGGKDPLNLRISAFWTANFRLPIGMSLDHFKTMAAFRTLILENGHRKSLLLKNFSKTRQNVSLTLRPSSTPPSLPSRYSGKGCRSNFKCCRSGLKKNSAHIQRRRR